MSETHQPPRWIFAAGVVAMVLAWTLGQLNWDEVRANSSRVVVALIGVGGTLVTALSGVWLWQKQEDARETARRDAEETRQSVLKEQHAEFQLRLAGALRAEISASLDRLRTQFTDEMAQASLAAAARNIAAADLSANQFGMPRSVGMEENIIFSSHQAQILDLEDDGLVRELVRYYQADAYVARYLSAMTDGVFDLAAQDRRNRAVVNYIILGQSAFIAAVDACQQLDTYLDRLVETSDVDTIGQSKRSTIIDDKLLAERNDLQQEDETDRRERYADLMLRAAKHVSATAVRPEGADRAEAPEAAGQDVRPR
ncbi:MAG: hypothetical protein AAFV62_03570 [Pseudomonadota bacterium]